MKNEREHKDAGASPEYTTKNRIIEAAGPIFAQKGFDRATSREICDQAHANQAAVNYHFGGKEQLYVEVLREAHQRLVHFGALKTFAEESDLSEEKIEAFFLGYLRSLLGNSQDSWGAKMMLREMAAPTAAFDELVQLQIRPTAMLFRSLAAFVMGLPVEHEAVVRGTLSIVAQFAFLCQNRKVVELVHPELDLSPPGIDRMARHIWRFTFAGLKAVASDYLTGNNAGGDDGAGGCKDGTAR